MTERETAGVVTACIACGLLGFTVGMHNQPRLPLVVAPPARPLLRLLPVATPAPPEVDAGAVAVIAPAEVPVKVPLTEPRPGEGMLDPLRPASRPPPGVDGGRDRVAARADELARRAAAEAAANAAKLAATDTAKQLDDMAAQLRDLKEQLSDAKERQQTAAADAEQRVAANREGLTALQGADAKLALGNGDIEAELATAKANLVGQSAVELLAAEDALRNSDLFAARAHLQIALLLSAKSANDIPPPP